MVNGHSVAVVIVVCGWFVELFGLASCSFVGARVTDYHKLTKVRQTLSNRNYCRHPSQNDGQASFLVGFRHCKQCDGSKHVKIFCILVLLVPKTSANDEEAA